MAMLTQQAWHRALQQHRKKYLALYHLLKQHLLKQEASGLTPVPSERDLAARLGLSRGTVRLAFEMLVADGFLSAQAGHGYHPVTERSMRHNGTSSVPPQMSPAILQLSRLARDVHSFHADRAEHPRLPVPFDLRAGGFSSRDFPSREWKRSMHEGLRNASWLDGSTFCDPSGWQPLREAIASHLRARRGFIADPDQIFITSGSGQALALLSLLLISRGQRIPVEEPCYSGTRSIIRMAGGMPVPIKLDREGMLIPLFGAKVAFLSPANQYPTGITYSRERMQGIIEWARRHRSWIIEDDYDADFRRRGLPPEPLCSLAPDRVCYTGTFSRSMGPALRIGYAVLPRAICGPFLDLKRMFEERPANLLEQAALAAFMRSGAYERHLRRCNRALSARYDALRRILEDTPGRPFQIHPSRTGLHIYAEWVLNEASFPAFQKGCLDQGLHFTQASTHHARPHRPAMLFGFSRITIEDMASLPGILARAMKAARREAGYRP